MSGVHPMTATVRPLMQQLADALRPFIVDNYEHVPSCQCDACNARAALDRYDAEKDGGGWRCEATGSVGANDSQDCDWPVCGCDPYAEKVLAALGEQGLTLVPDVTITTPPSASQDGER